MPLFVDFEGWLKKVKLMVIEGFRFNIYCCQKI